MMAATALISSVGGAFSFASSAASTNAGPVRTATQSSNHQQVAVLAGGCFWGMEGLFEHVKGVSSVVSGYAGGTRETANYRDVSSERTGHADAIRIVYDPGVVSYAQLLRVYFMAAHDPTQVDRQLPDQRHSYRSAIFPQDGTQRAEAAAYVATLGRTHVFTRPIATHLESGAFFPAEPYHQQFMRRNPGHPYIVQWDLPRLKSFHDHFPDLYRA